MPVSAKDPMRVTIRNIIKDLQPHIGKIAEYKRDGAVEFVQIKSLSVNVHSGLVLIRVQSIELGSNEEFNLYHDDDFSIIGLV